MKDVPGPANPSWIFGVSHLLLSARGAECKNLQGHQWYLMTEEAGGAEKRFLETFGNVIRWNGPFGVRPACYQTYTSILSSESLLKMIGMCVQEDRLWIADPKAISHILQKSGYLYAKSSDVRERGSLLTDHGILWADGELSTMVNPRLLQVRLTIPQATSTSVIGG